MPRSRHPISATDLASLARCEQQFMFDQERGHVRSRSWQRKARAGRRTHAAENLRVRLGGAARGDPCYIASAVFGESGPETRRLRAWRDRVLARSLPGRVLIAIYYRLAPMLARRLTSDHAATRLIRVGLRSLLRRMGDRQ